MNPCPCGYFSDSEKECRCSANEVFRYQKKISGPLLDRIDIQIEVPRVKIDELRKKRGENSSETMKAKNKIIKARQIQSERFKKMKIKLNSEMDSKTVDEMINLSDQAEIFLKNILEKSFVSARGYYRVLKVARTIADLEESKGVESGHLAEAFQYRLREKE